VAIASTPSKVSAASLQEWEDIATKFISNFEGSAYDAITLDIDCQGLSLGKEQYALGENSTKELFDEIDKESGKDGIDGVIDQTAATHKKELKNFVALARKKAPERMDLARSWQEVRDGTEWVPLTEGECKSGKKRSLTRKDLRLDKGIEKDMAALLDSEPSRKAQNKLLARRGRMALDRSTCWALQSRNAGRPSFQEYLFYMDYLIQNGDSFTSDGTLQDAVLRMRLGDPKLEPSKNPEISAKMRQIVDWMNADFPHMRNPKLKEDHGDYARLNAVTWWKRFEAGESTQAQVQLAYLGLLRAILGNNQWAYNAMNRRGTIAFIGGKANGKPYEREAVLKLFQSAGEIDDAELKGIACAAP
jgi:hypothetical protein